MMMIVVGDTDAIDDDNRVTSQLASKRDVNHQKGKRMTVLRMAHYYY